MLVIHASHGTNFNIDLLDQLLWLTHIKFTSVGIYITRAAHTMKTRTYLSDIANNLIICWRIDPGHK